jgi:hypothetical protein
LKRGRLREKIEKRKGGERERREKEIHLIT